MTNPNLRIYSDSDDSTSASAASESEPSCTLEKEIEAAITNPDGTINWDAANALTFALGIQNPDPKPTQKDPPR